MKSKKGMDAIVTTVIMVALALIAIGIIWAVISTLIANRSGDINVQSQCLNTQLEITAGSCWTNTGTTDLCENTCCNATVRRKGGTDLMKGVRLALGSVANDSSSDISVGTIANVTVYSTTVLKGKLSAIAIYDVGGKPSYCSQAAEYTIA